MALLTKKAIMSTFEEMLKEMPFHKITVSSLVHRSGVSSNAFYYNYHDIYDLLDHWIIFKLQSLIDYNDWKNTIRSIFIYSKENQQEINHIFYSFSCEQLVRCVSNISNNSSQIYTQKLACNENISEESLTNISDFCRYAIIGFYFKFIWNHMDDDIEAQIDELSSIFDNFISSYIKTHI